MARFEVTSARQSQVTWHPVAKTAACAPQCPSEGHRVRLDAPGAFDNVQHAESRVRVLHAVYRLRNAWLPLGVTHSLAVLLNRIVGFGRVIDIRATDDGTWRQLKQLEWLICSTLARRIVDIYDDAKEVSYNQGRRGDLRAR